MKAANEAVARKGGDTFAIRDNLVRVATTNEHVHQLQQTAVSLPSISQWLDADEVQKKTGCQTLGGLFMHNGCRVVHVPLYLAGLYTACQDLAGSTQSSLSWKEVGNNELESPTLPQLDNENDTVVYCGGAGMFSSERRNGTISLSGDEFGTVLFPAQLVRGQSLELRLEQPLSTAFVCGKYVSPLLPSPQGDPCSVVVGATHEFQAEPLSIDKVVEEMQKRTSDFCGADWIRNAEIKRSTMGYRVQSNRGMYGRRPIVGRLDGTDGKKASWIFSGLGSRGLLYHGLYGDMLSDAILLDNEEVLTEFCPDFLWWKK